MINLSEAYQSVRDVVVSEYFSDCCVGLDGGGRDTGSVGVTSPDCTQLSRPVIQHLILPASASC